MADTLRETYEPPKLGEVLRNRSVGLDDNTICIRKCTAVSKTLVYYIRLDYLIGSEKEWTCSHECWAAFRDNQVK